MSSTESPLSVSFTPGKPAMVTVRADTADGWLALAREVAASGMLTEVRNINDLLNGVRPASQPAAAKAEQDQQLPDSFGVKCKVCGGKTRLVSKDKKSPKNGKTYDIHECQDNNLHQATFIEK